VFVTALGVLAVALLCSMLVKAGWFIWVPVLLALASLAISPLCLAADRPRHRASAGSCDLTPRFDKAVA
jgi:hypothetical protein